MNDFEDRSYCELVEKASTLTLEDRLAEARGAIARAYENVGGSLTDDVHDVYGEIRDGFVHWDAGHERSAVWEWRFGFDTHWGDHAVDALRALHRACSPV